MGLIAPARPRSMGRYFSRTHEPVHATDHDCLFEVQL